MAQSVIVKKDEKVNVIFSSLGANCTFEEFAVKFKEDYPKEWANIQKVYRDHEKRDTKGKGHPMPEPTQYLKNTFNTGIKKYKNTIK